MAEVKIVRRRRKGRVKIRPEVSSSGGLSEVVEALSLELGLDQATSRELLLQMGQPRDRAA